MKTGWKWLFGLSVIFAVLILPTTAALANRETAIAAQASETLTISPVATRTGLRLVTATIVSEDDILKNAPVAPPGCRPALFLIGAILAGALAGALGAFSGFAGRLYFWR